MHKIQKALLLLSEDFINQHSLREIGKIIGEKHAFKVSYHLNKLRNKNYKFGKINVEREDVETMIALKYENLKLRVENIKLKHILEEIGKLSKT